jgi:hypothetical protein
MSLCIALVLANALNISTAFEKMSSLADEVSNSAESPYQIREIWQSKRDLFELSIEDDEIEQMNEMIESLISAYESNDRSQIVKYCRLISDLCDELMSFEKVSIKSIF